MPTAASDAFLMASLPHAAPHETVSQPAADPKRRGVLDILNLRPGSQAEEADVTRNTEINQTTSWCRTKPLKCARQIITEGIIITAAYLALLFFAKGFLPKWHAIGTFMAAFLVLSFMFRYLSDDLGDKVSMAAVMAIGSKLFSIMAPGLVTW